MGSVTQDWVIKLPLRHQGVLLSAMRGCDTAPKGPYDSTERQLVAYLRYLVLNPADIREVGILGAFMQAEPPKNWKQSDLGHYPMHWVAHIMHGYQVVAYCHPDLYLANLALDIYRELVHGLHLNVESEYSMNIRLTEDRIANGKVVS